MSTELWLRQFFPTPGAPVRVVLLPHAGGSATFYLPLARALAMPVSEAEFAETEGVHSRRRPA